MSVADSVYIVIVEGIWGGGRMLGREISGSIFFLRTDENCPGGSVRVGVFF